MSTKGNGACDHGWYRGSTKGTSVITGTTTSQAILLFDFTALLVGDLEHLWLRLVVVVVAFVIVIDVLHLR